MDQKKEPGSKSIPVKDVMKQMQQDIDILKAGYRECIKDLEASNKLLAQHLGMDPVQLTGEVMGHRSVLDTVSSGSVE